MQSRRHEEFRGVSSPSEKIRNQRYDLGSDPYLGSRRGNPNRSPRVRRSLSPQKVDRRGFLDGDRRSGSWHLRGGWTEKENLGSPIYEQLRKRPHLDEEIVRKNYEFSRPVNHDTNVNTRLKDMHRLDHSASRMDGINRRGMLGPEADDESVRGSHRLPPDMGPLPNYGETGRHLPSPLRNDIGLSENGKPRYWNPIPSDQLAQEELYRRGEKPVFHPTDVSHNTVPTSYSKDFATASHLKDFASSSSDIAKGDFLGAYQDGVFLPRSDEFPNRSGKLMETMNIDPYGQRPLIEYARDPEAEKRNLTINCRGTYSPPRLEHDNYCYTKPRGISNVECRYQDGLHRMRSPHAEIGYDPIRIDYDHRDFSRSSIMHPALDRVGNFVDSSENLRKRCKWDHPLLQNQKVSDNLDIGSDALDRGGVYVGSGYARVEFGRKVSEDYEMLQKGVLRDSQISHLRSDHRFRRDTDPGTQREKSFKIPSMSGCESEMNRASIRARRMRDEELGTYEAEDKGLKRKYILEEGVRGHNSRTIMPSKWNTTPRVFRDRYNGDEEWTDNDNGEFYLSRSGRFDYHEYGEADRTYEEQDHHEDFGTDDLLEHKYPLEHSQGHSVKFYKSGSSSRYIKGHQRHGSLSGSHHHPGRSGFSHKQRKVWKRIVDYHEDDQADDGDPEEDWESSVRTEPTEGSEEFKQLVDEAFLKYSKKLNMNSSVRKRYKEQGKAGSLFCIVCGRSLSKEFMDTRRLVTHAFMSRKVGLRAQHLGLHKAICVLLGWNSVATLETITGPPHVLSDAEAVAQKEDLMLWPPVVIIHNISLSNYQKEPKIITIEGLEAFLRGKGFIGGRIKICLGKPADQSIMVVKFLGTFSGLESAEKIHEYFSDNEHGRIDFERIVSKNGNSGGARMRGDEREEQILYGYMGISDDLDKLDFNTKRVSLIKSKKEILDLANAPVKPETGSNSQSVIHKHRV